jgi:RND family efflux transporter MFP subunit
MTAPVRLVLWTAGVLAFAACRPDSPTPAREKEKPRAFHAVRVRSETVERTVRSFGSLAAYDQAALSAKVDGRLERLAVDLGTVVRQGDLIAQIDPRDYKLRLEQAEAQLAQARVRLGLPAQGDGDTVNLEETSGVRQARAVLIEAQASRDRIRNLAEQKIISKSEVETVEAAFAVAQSRFQDAMETVRTQQSLVVQRRVELRIARQHLDDTAILAPFDGTVQERKASLGEYLPASTPVVSLVRIHPLRLRLEVVEREAPRIAVGQAVRLTLQGTTNVYTGEIRRLSPALDEKSRMLRIEADVPNPGPLRPGSFVTADIVTHRTDRVPVIPPAGIVTFAGMERVFVFEGGKAVEKSITTGRRVASGVEVADGLKEGETVILDPGSLPNGAAVTITIDSPEPESVPEAPAKTGGLGG